MSEVNQMADIIRNAAEYTPYWTDDPATHQDPYENAAKALLAAGYERAEGRDYEYTVEWTYTNTGEKLFISEWDTLEKAHGVLNEYTLRADEALAKGGEIYYTGEIVRRRMAGEPGKVERVDA